MRKTEQLSEIWQNTFGVEYTKRKLKVHETEGHLREKFWFELVQMLQDAQSYLEIGCNAGMNLQGIHKANSRLDLTGIEPNDYALEKANEKLGAFAKIIKGNIFELSSEIRADLVFTCTVLIHIAPVDLLSTMNNIFYASKRYILTMEYYWPVVKEIEYRGLRNALWKQDFGALWLQNYDIHLIETGYLDHRDGFDRVTYWLLRKQL